MIELKKRLILILIFTLFLSLVGCNQEEDVEDILTRVACSIVIDLEISADFVRLPKQIENVEIEWQSSDEDLIKLDGSVIRPQDGDKSVTLTATLSLSGQIKIVNYDVLVKARDVNPQEIIDIIKDGLMIEGLIFENLDLPTYINDVSISWKSSNEDILTNEGVIIHSNFSLPIENVSLEATLSFHGVINYKTFTIRIPSYQKIFYKVNGFAGLNLTSLNINRGDPGYYVVTNEKEFIEALTAINDTNVGSFSAKVIEITNDLNLGYLEVNEKFPDANFSSTIFRSHRSPKNHPVLLKTGVSRITIQDRKEGTNFGEGLVIFSPNGAIIKHSCWVIRRSENIVIRNLEFDELWEYDDTNEYDANDWDYITIEDVNGIWLDHLTLGKAYDGLIDIKGKSRNVSITWCKFYVERTAFIEEQIYYLEQNIDLFPFYKLLRTSGLTVEDIIEINSIQKKGHLVGASELHPDNDTLAVTLAYNYYYNIQDRIPRLRGGDAHVFNIIHDASNIYELRRVYTGLNFTNQGLVTTENGSVLMENSIFIDVTSPIKNNQKSDLEPQFTGKYLVINSIYKLGNFSQLSSSTDNHSFWRHINKAETLAFSFNNFEEIPYNYQLIDVNKLEEYLIDKLVGTTKINVNWLLYGGE